MRSYRATSRLNFEVALNCTTVPSHYPPVLSGEHGRIGHGSVNAASWFRSVKPSADLGGPVKAIRDATPQALHHFTQADQVNQLVGASEADPALGFMARTMALCSLPRTNPGNRLQYKRVNGPYKLIMTATGDHKLPYGNLPRLLMAWLCDRSGTDPKPRD